MILLVVFAVVAGAGTALTPCVLPVLPALLAATGSGGRRRPLGVILGLVTTFTVTIVALASVIDGVGLPDGAVRTLAVVVLLAFGLSLLVPSLAARVEAPLTRLARFGPSDRGEGFWSGLVVLEDERELDVEWPLGARALEVALEVLLGQLLGGEREPRLPRLELAEARVRRKEPALEPEARLVEAERGLDVRHVHDHPSQLWLHAGDRRGLNRGRLARNGQA